jgi:hypothetical protein
MYYYENSNSNLKLNELIPIIEEKTNTQSNADKGYIGYWYKSDTIFYNDINQWKKILGCK